jgi:hypothetical protein
MSDEQPVVEAPIFVEPKKGIQETKDLILAVDALADCLKDVMADGQFSLMDLPKMIVLFAPVKQAMEGLNLVGEELKDLDAEESSMLMAELSVAMAKIMDIFKKPA